MTWIITNPAQKIAAACAQKNWFAQIMLAHALVELIWIRFQHRA